jgi:transcriptional regulator of acetoin/glycerol metabolism|tara:strand:- start:16 stop:282 length:267 start_codon:yes stop_codon:yes gene_type:complete
MNDVGMVHGLPVRDVVDAIVGDFYMQAKEDQWLRDRIMQQHVEITDARPAFCYLDERGLARVKANRDRRLKQAGIETKKGQSIPDWLK